MFRAEGITTRTSSFPGIGDRAEDLAGGPVPVHTPGHTEGRCAYHLPALGIVVSGDALVTVHPTSRKTAPHLLPDMFHTDVPAALGALSALEPLDADTLLSGHGPLHRGSVREAVARAREQAVR